MSAQRVLIVDDNVLNLELAAFVLEADGFIVETARDAATALQCIPAFKPGVMLMDIQMPDVDGLSLTRQLKADPATAGIVVLAFTAYAMKGDEAKMLAAGCDGYIAKPIDVATFAEVVRRGIDAAG